MKKQLMVAAAAVIALSAAAEGYQVNSLSAKQTGMGHTGTALKLKSESMFFNPAGMGWMDETIHFSGSVNAIFSHAQTENVSITSNGTTIAEYPGKKFETDNDPSTPLNISLAFSIYDNLKAGISFFTPYGSGIDWGMNWPGATLNQSVALKVYTVQPTVAWRILPNLSIGAGAMISWGTVDLNKAIIPAHSLGLPIVPASVNLNGKANTTAGINAGIMWDVNKKITLGFQYRQKMMMTVDAGDATVTYGSPEIEQNKELAAIKLINGDNFKAEMPCPQVFSFGVSYRPIEKLTLAFDAQLTGWNAYDELNIDFATAPDAFDQKIEKNYKNAWTFHLGGEYALTDRFDVRAGLMVDTTPCDEDFYNAETPGMTKVEPSVGFSFRPVKGLSIDLACMYVAGLGADDRECTYVNMITKQPETFKADYSLDAWVPAIGFSYSF